MSQAMVEQRKFDSSHREDKAITPVPPRDGLLVDRSAQQQTTSFHAQGVCFGGEAIQIIAGPCTVESRQQILEVAFAVKEAGATALRGGAYKPRTSPYSFQGHAEKALQWLAEAREETGLAIVTEVLDPACIEQVESYADVLQIGSRSMQNFALLRGVAQCHTPVMLKRGMSSTIEEFLLAAEYILAGGNHHVMLCERGIRTFSDETRNTFDINAIPVLKQRTHLPILADPSHATGKWEYVEAMAKAAVAAGADGLLIEVHPHPEDAVSDGRQSLKPERFAAMMRSLHRIAAAVDRPIGKPKAHLRQAL